ncbi:hypothetical protein B0H21DRAFT_827410 [Amylocystis lapponica]|nr:hypothetical protein B0H21DRAFT_827410 [Amylocystis lapponica]
MFPAHREHRRLPSRPRLLAPPPTRAHHHHTRPSVAYWHTLHSPGPARLPPREREHCCGVLVASQGCPADMGHSQALWPCSSSSPPSLALSGLHLCHTALAIVHAQRTSTSPSAVKRHLAKLLRPALIRKKPGRSKAL